MKQENLFIFTPQGIFPNPTLNFEPIHRKNFGFQRNYIDDCFREDVPYYNKNHNPYSAKQLYYGMKNTGYNPLLYDLLNFNEITALMIEVWKIKKKWGPRYRYYGDFLWKELKKDPDKFFSHSFTKGDIRSNEYQNYLYVKRRYNFLKKFDSVPLEKRLYELITRGSIRLNRWKSEGLIQIRDKYKPKNNIINPYPRGIRLEKRLSFLDDYAKGLFRANLEEDRKDPRKEKEPYSDGDFSIPYTSREAAERIFGIAKRWEEEYQKEKNK